MKKNLDTKKLTSICEKKCLELGYELFDAGFEKEPEGIYLRVYIDKEDGISLDDCERYHRALQNDVENFDYDFMEVCSPGIDRPLKSEKDIARNIGNQVEVHLYKAVEGSKTHAGALVRMDREEVVIEFQGSEKHFKASTVSQVRLVPDLSGLYDDSEAIELSETVDT